jgi:VAD1 Analog of StAR-related lipid transfer domain
LDIDCDDYSSLEAFEDYSLREFKFVHPLKEKIPFGPKVSHIDCKEKYFWISPEEFYLEKEVFVSKVPYCDYFTVRLLYHVHRDHLKENAPTHIDHKLYVNFIKSTAFKGKIENGTLTENT